MSPSPLVAVLDANVLYPMTLRDTLLRAAEVDLYQPRWSTPILDEMERNLVEGEVMTADKAARLRSVMTEAFEEAEVTGFEHRIAGLANDEKDRHVVAAAVDAEAAVIVTSNLKDFRPLPEGLVAQTPDEFLRHLLDRHPPRVVRLLRQQAADRRQPPVSFEVLLTLLEKVTPEFIASVRKHMA